MGCVLVANLVLMRGVVGVLLATGKMVVVATIDILVVWEWSGSD